jgi:hypothetical protein
VRRVWQALSFEEGRQMKSIASPALAISAFCFITADCSYGQSTSPGSSSAPVLGSTIGVSPPAHTRMISGSGNLDILRHRNFAGKPCLTVEGYARVHPINPNLYDHVIDANNACPQTIKLKVCYYGSRDCVPMEVPGRMTREAVLGTLPSIKDFQYEFREQF